MRINQDRSHIRYFLYARKSSEDEDRQIQSIESQVTKLRELAQEDGLKIVKSYTEAKSAKAPGVREIFDEMIGRIEDGEADGILCWQINRLSRNPVDSGKISWLLQKNIIKSIQTYDREYLPGDNVLIFSVDAATSNQFVIDLSKNVKRGLETKLTKGWLPNLAPSGYLNDQLEKTITKDAERFNLVNKMWQLMLTGAYTPPQILKIANEEWGYRTRKSKKLGGKPLSRSGIYRIFTNIFYAGVIEHKGVQFQGKHEPMITLEEFDQVQVLLGRKGKPRPKEHFFAFTGFIRCAECGCLYTAETKKKFIKKTGKIEQYTYYHCTRKKTTINCSQRKMLPLEKLELQVEKELEGLTILPEFRDWALEILNENNDREIEDRSKIYEMQHNNLVTTQKELDNLTKMRYRDLIDDDTFIKERNELQTKVTEMKGKLRHTEDRAVKWLELTEKTFNFATYARMMFLKANEMGKQGLELKKEILMALGLNPQIKAGKLYIDTMEWFVPIEKRAPLLQKQYLGLELGKKPATKAQSEAIASIRARWRGSRD
ncbi:MAG: recombinase family protein [Patescibacteria group bacterium]|nr:recombinase family protein [Patescibacteria group bacterium]